VHGHPLALTRGQGGEAGEQGRAHGSCGLDRVHVDHGLGQAHQRDPAGPGTDVQHTHTGPRDVPAVEVADACRVPVGLKDVVELGGDGVGVRVRPGDRCSGDDRVHVQLDNV
jgi:hypothetical protein